MFWLRAAKLLLMSMVVADICVVISIVLAYVFDPFKSPHRVDNIMSTIVCQCTWTSFNYLVLILITYFNYSNLSLIPYLKETSYPN